MTIITDPLPHGSNTIGGMTITVNGAPVSGANPLPTLAILDATGLEIPPPVGGATEAKQDTQITAIGGVTETAPATDTASSGVNGRLQRIAQRLTSLIGLLPTALTGSGNLKTAILEAIPAGSNAIGSVTVSSLPALAAGTNVIGITRGTSQVLDLTLSLDTSAYASGDVLADTQELASAAPVNAGHALLHSLVINDKDDQGQALDVVFLRSNVSIGTENAAVSITDANADEILGIVQVSSSDFIDLGGCRVATLSGLGLVLEAGAATTSVYVAAISRGTGTYTASGITMRIGLAQQDAA